MESLPQNPEFRNNPENFHLYVCVSLTRGAVCCYAVCDYHTHLLSNLGPNCS